MKKTLSHFIFIILIMPSHAQISHAYPGSTAQGNSRPVVTLTFTFKSTPAGVVGYQGDGGVNKFYIQFPVSNKPTTSISDIDSEVEIRREKEKSTDQAIVYSITFQRGTSPRFGPGVSGNELVLSFTPESSSPTAVPAPPATSGPTSANSIPPAPSGSSSSATPGTGSGASPQTPAAATPPSSNSNFNEAVNFANTDLSVPESPAFTVLGLTPQTVVRPTSPRQFASSLLNGLDQRGNLQSGIALDFAPYLIYAGRALTLKNYRDSYLSRFLSRAQTSFATTKGASENDKSLRAALGFHLTLMDKGDPHSDALLIQCFRDKLTFPAPPSVPNASTDDPQRKEASARDVLVSEECRQESRKRNWNRSSWIVAFAPAWMSPTGETGDLHYDGGGVWTSLAYGFEGVKGLKERSQLIFHARYRDNEMVPDPEKKGNFFKQDGLFLGGRARVGNENASVSFEGVFQRLRRVGMPFDNSTRLAIGLERRIADNIWFNIAFGGQTDVPMGKRNGFVLTTFKWGFSEKNKPDKK